MAPRGTVPLSRTRGSPGRRDRARRRCCSRRDAAAKASADDTDRVAAVGQSRQRRTLAQHDPSGFESGRRGGVSDLGGGGQPTAEASAASASRSSLARTRNVARWVVRSGLLLFGLAAVKELCVSDAAFSATRPVVRECGSSMTQTPLQAAGLSQQLLGSGPPRGNGGVGDRTCRRWRFGQLSDALFAPIPVAEPRRVRRAVGPPEVIEDAGLTRRSRTGGPGDEGLLGSGPRAAARDRNPQERDAFRRPPGCEVSLTRATMPPPPPVTG
jgi:hypothetical protein